VHVFNVDGRARAAEDNIALPFGRIVFAEDFNINLFPKGVANFRTVFVGKESGEYTARLGYAHADFVAAIKITFIGVNLGPFVRLCLHKACKKTDA
jgi:hypothetical protein